MGAIANVQADIVQLLACRTTITVVLGQVGKSLRAVAGIVLSQRAVSCAHIGRDAAIQQPLQKTPRYHRSHRRRWRRALVLTAAPSGGACLGRRPSPDSCVRPWL